MDNRTYRELPEYKDVIYANKDNAGKLKRFRAL